MQRRGVDNKHAETCACNDTGEVVVVAYSVAAEGEGEFGFYGEDLWSEVLATIQRRTTVWTYVEALDDEDRKIHCSRRQLISFGATLYGTLTDGLSLAQSINLFVGMNDLSATIGEVRAALGEEG